MLFKGSIIQENSMTQINMVTALVWQTAGYTQLARQTGGQKFGRKVSQDHS
jgi:hypothetical protein